MDQLVPTKLIRIEKILFSYIFQSRENSATEISKNWL